MDHPAIAVFTERSADEILDAGGSGAWVLNPKNAAKQRYLVCCRKGSEGGEANAAFLVGLIKRFVPVGENIRSQKRFRIEISDYARLEAGDTWRGWRNPVRYTSLEDLGIDPDELRFRPAPPARKRSAAEEAAAEIPRTVRKLTIAEAKEGLAAMLGVSVDQIDIIIRG